MQVRAAHPAKIRIIRGGKKKTHSSAFDKFETFVFKKHRDACAPCYFDSYWGSPRITRIQVRAAHPAKIRIIRGGKKKTHSPAFVKFEIFVFKKTPRCLRALLFRFRLGFPQPPLTPNYIPCGRKYFTRKTGRPRCALRGSVHPYYRPLRDC